MIHTTQDFFNKAITDIRQKYFPNENHGYTQNKDYHAATYAMELFNNGCLTYRALIGKLAKICKVKNSEIHAIIEQYIVSFGSYTYKPKN